jgi:hypothetical protein
VLIKYNQLSGVDPIGSEVPKNFQLSQNYPNPFNPTTTIKFSVPKRSFIQVKIFDVLGRLKESLVNQNMYASEYQLILDGSGYCSGVYFYQLIANGEITDTKRFVVLK